MTPLKHKEEASHDCLLDQKSGDVAVSTMDQLEALRVNNKMKQSFRMVLPSRQAMLSLVCRERSSFVCRHKIGVGKRKFPSKV